MATKPTSPTAPPQGSSARTVALPSGKTAVIRAGTARDGITAQMLSAACPELYFLALIATLCTFDGAQLTMEDVGALDLEDYHELLPLLPIGRGTLPASSSALVGSATSGTTP